MELVARAIDGLSANVAVEGDGAVHVGILGNEFLVGDIFVAIDEDARVSGTPLLHLGFDGDESAVEFQDVGGTVGSANHWSEAHDAGSGADFVPEAVTKHALGLLELLVGAKLIEFGDDADNFWETVSLGNAQEFESFEFETEGTVDHDDGKIANFGEIAHRAEFGRTLDEGDAAGATNDARDGAGELGDVAVGVELDH